MAPPSLPSLLLAAMSCDRSEPSSEYVALGPVEHAVRASLVLRGIRPSTDELELVRKDPAAVESLVDS